MNNSMKTKKDNNKNRGGALFVAVGIFLSRVFGLIREKIFAHYFGNSLAADAFKTALRIPNFIQNLLGEGVLSASFIPVYAQLLSENKEKEAEKVVSLTATFLFLLTSVLVLLGLYFTPVLVDWIAPGFSGERRQLTEEMVYLFFPAVGILVLSAFCLGILNSHRRFFLPYVAPVVWNLAIIFAMVYFQDGRSQNELILMTAWGMLIGSLLQFLIQLPLAVKLIKSLSINFEYKNLNFKIIYKNFLPAVLSRGVIQISSFIDSILASWLVTGSVAVLSYAQILYLLPISLFGMSLSASELPEMSQGLGTSEEKITFIRKRLYLSLQRLNFFIIPSMIGFLILGQEMLRILYLGGQFTENDVQAVWIVLLGYGISLVASAEGRLFNSAFYAMKNTHTPLKISILQVVSSTFLGLMGLFLVTDVFHRNDLWTPVVLTLASSVASWIAWLSSRRNLNRMLGAELSSTKKYKMKLILIALVSSFLALGVKWGVNSLNHRMYFSINSVLSSFIVLAVFGLFYLWFSMKFKLTENVKIRF